MDGEALGLRALLQLTERLPRRRVLLVVVCASPQPRRRLRLRGAPSCQSRRFEVSRPDFPGRGVCPRRRTGPPGRRRGFGCATQGLATATAAENAWPHVLNVERELQLLRVNVFHAFQELCGRAGGEVRGSGGPHTAATAEKKEARCERKGAVRSLRPAAGEVWNGERTRRSLSRRRCRRAPSLACAGGGGWSVASFTRSHRSSLAK